MDPDGVARTLRRDDALLTRRQANGRLDRLRRQDPRQGAKVGMVLQCLDDCAPVVDAQQRQAEIRARIEERRAERERRESEEARAELDALLAEARARRAAEGGDPDGEDEQ